MWKGATNRQRISGCRPAPAYPFIRCAEGHPVLPLRHDEMVTLVERMLELHKHKQSAGSEAVRARLEREIGVTDEHIDRLVYELYRLTEEEIRIVEGVQ